MIVRKLRLQRGWSQDHLSQISGLSVRTIQRIERGQEPSLESLKAFAAVFEINVTDLQTETNMHDELSVTNEEKAVIDQVRALKDFYSHVITYVVVIAALFIINYLFDPGYIWAWWAAMGWGIGVLSHAVSTFELFNLFDSQWEKREIEKRLNRKL